MPIYNPPPSTTVTVSSTAPSNPKVGDYWYDTSGG